MRENYKIKYVSSTGVELNLSGAGIDAHCNNMPSWEFEHVSLNSRLIGFTRSLPEIEIGLIVVADSAEAGIAAKNALYEIPAADRAVMSPGRLYLNDWYLTGYVKAVTVDNFWQLKRAAQYVLTFVATEPLWTREVERTFTAGSTDGLDFPFDFAFDYAMSVSSDSISNENYAPSFVRIAIQGAAQSPSVTIGGNRYKVDVDVSSGERLEIDGQAKTVEIVGMDGTRTNVFDKRAGNQTLGSGEYVFEKIPSGESPVVYDNGLQFSVTVIEQRAEPRWA